MPIYSPVGYLDITNATLRTSNLEAQNFRLNGGNIYVTSELTTNELLNLDNVVNAGNATSNTVQFTNPTTGLVVDSNIVVAGNVTAAFLHGDASNVTAVPAAQITGTLAVANGGTGTTTSTGTGSVVLSDAPTFTGDVTFDTNTLFVDSANDRVGVGTTTPGTTLDVLGNGAFLHAGSGTPHNSNDLILRLGGLNNGGGIIQSKCAIIATPDTAYGGEADYGRNAIHFCIDNSQTNTNASKSNHRISIKPDGLVGIRNANPVKRLHIKGYSNEILAGLDHVTAANDEHVGLGFGVTDSSQGNRIFKGGIFFERKGGITGRGDLLFCIENTGDNTSEVSPANEIMRITRNSVVGITGNLSVTGNATFDTDTLFVDSVNDRVGIGTTTPECLLHLSSATGTSSIVPTKLKIHTTSAGGDWNSSNPWGLIEFDTDDASGSGSGPVAGIGARCEGANGGNTSLCFYTDGDNNDDTTLGSANERMCIDHDGNVGIGTTSPQGQLHISSGTSGDCVMILQADTDNNNEGDNPRIEFWQDGSLQESAIVQGNNELQIMNSVSSSGGIVFYTGTVTGYTNAVERMRINPSGNVGIGTTSPSYKLEVSGDIYASGNVTAYSDRRAKSNIKKIQNPLDKIDKISGYTYTMKVKDKDDPEKEKRFTGLIAQEVLEILP